MDTTDRASTEGGAGSPQRKPRSERDSLLLIANIAVAGGPAQDVRIRNLSANGLMAELGIVVEPGTPVSIDVRGIGRVAGKIVWCTEGRIGITLDRTIDPKLARKPVSGGTHTPIYATPAIPPRRH